MYKHIQTYIYILIYKKYVHIHLYILSFVKLLFDTRRKIIIRKH